MPGNDRVAVVLTDKRIAQVDLSECSRVLTGGLQSTARFALAFTSLREWLTSHSAPSDAFPPVPSIGWSASLEGMWVTPNGLPFVALRRDWFGAPLEYFEVARDVAERFLDAAGVASLPNSHVLPDMLAAGPQEQAGNTHPLADPVANEPLMRDFSKKRILLFSMHANRLGRKLAKACDGCVNDFERDGHPE